ncbi:MAG TPA: hypothetical protein PLY61_16030 [Anaerohalosphaeraceae bacterium]|nr:hypothetical protein [Anaerohalosphaeraceae bacterium]
MLLKRALVILVSLFCMVRASALSQNLGMEMQKQEAVEGKWKALKGGMGEKQVVLLLGRPKMIWRSTSTCYYYYDEIPAVHVSAVSKRKSVTLTPSTIGAGADASQMNLPKGCVEFYYGPAEPAKSLQTYSPPARLSDGGEVLIRGRVSGGWADYFHKDVLSPNTDMYRVKKARLPDLVNMRLGTTPSTDYWDELTGFEDKREWQDPKRWKRLPNSVTPALGRAGATFPSFTERTISQLFGEPHTKTNSPRKMVWQYGDIDAFGEITFVTDATGKNVLSEWTEPYWPDVQTSLSNPHGTEPSLPKPSEDGNKSIEEKAEPPSTLWTSKDSWLRITKGMASKQVESILGNPDYVQTFCRVGSNPYQPVRNQLFYCYGLPPGHLGDVTRFPLEIPILGNGIVVFDQVQRNRYTVSSWKEPKYDDIVALTGFTKRTVSAKRGREKWEQPELWQKLRPNLPAKMVEQLLGRPQYRQEGSSEMWRYGDVEDCGILQFAGGDAGREPVLRVWSEPYWLSVEHEVYGQSQYKVVAGRTPAPDPLQANRTGTEVSNKSPVGHFKIRQLTDNDDDDILPAISDSTIVWQGCPKQASSILMYDGQTRQISTGNDNWRPKISGETIVWSRSSALIQYRGGRMVPLSKSTPLSYDVAGNAVIWQEQVRPGVYGVFYYDGGQTRKMFDALFACLPAVSAGGLAWVDRNQYMLYISKDGEIVNTRIRTATFFLRMSDATVALLCIDDRDKAILKYIRGWKQISGKTTPLLEDVPESQSFQASIYANTSREGLISDTLLDKYGPAIAGNRITWIDTDGNIRLFDGGHVATLQRGQNRVSYPQVNDAFVVWQEHDGNDYEIFAYDGTVIRQVSDNEYDDLFPQISGTNIVWQGWDGSDYEIFVCDLSS